MEEEEEEKSPQRRQESNCGSATLEADALTTTLTSWSLVDISDNDSNDNSTERYNSIFILGEGEGCLGFFFLPAYHSAVCNAQTHMATK